jgi:hypothetical protein
MGNSCRSSLMVSDTTTCTDVICVKSGMYAKKKTKTSLADINALRIPSALNTHTQQCAQIQRAVTRLGPKPVQENARADQVETTEQCSIQNTFEQPQVVTNASVAPEAAFEVGTGFMEEHTMQSLDMLTAPSSNVRFDNCVPGNWSNHNRKEKTKEKAEEEEKENLKQKDFAAADCSTTTVSGEESNHAAGNSLGDYCHDTSLSSVCEHGNRAYTATSAEIEIKRDHVLLEGEHRYHPPEQKMRRMLNKQQNKRTRRKRFCSIESATDINSKSLRNYEIEGSVPWTHTTPPNEVCHLVPFANTDKETRINIKSFDGSRTALALLVSSNAQSAVCIGVNSVSSKKHIFKLPKAMKTPLPTRPARPLSLTAGVVRANMRKHVAPESVLQTKPC